MSSRTRFRSRNDDAGCFFFLFFRGIVSRRAMERGVATREVRVADDNRVATTFLNLNGAARRAVRRGARRARRRCAPHIECFFSPGLFGASFLSENSRRRRRRLFSPFLYPMIPTQTDQRHLFRRLHRGETKICHLCPAHRRSIRGEKISKSPVPDRRTHRQLVDDARS